VTFHAANDSFETARVKFGTYLPLSQAVEVPLDRPNNKPMSDINRPELDARFKENEAKIAASEARVSERLAKFDASINVGFSEIATAMAKQAAALEKQADTLRIELAKQSGDLRTEMANVRADQHKSTVDIIKWVIGFGLATVGALVGIWRIADKLPPPAVNGADSTVSAQDTNKGSAPVPESLPPATSAAKGATPAAR